MSTLFVDLSQAIATKLNSVSGLNGVYAYEPATPTDGKYPFATITPSGFQAEFGDTIRNIRNYSYSIRLYQERKNFGNEKAERVMREIVDEIVTAFDADTTLSGMCKMVRPLSGDFEYIDREIGDTRFADITVECMGVVPSIT